jgi:hypothetical protein
MWREREMWQMLQNNVVAARHMKNHAIVAACGANNHVFDAQICLHVMLLCVRKNGRNFW